MYANPIFIYANPKRSTPDAYILKNMDILKDLCETWKSSGDIPDVSKKAFPFRDHKCTDNHAYFAHAICKMLKQYATQPVVH